MPVLAAVTCMSPVSPQHTSLHWSCGRGSLCNNRQVGVSWGLCAHEVAAAFVSVPSSGIMRLALPLQKKVDPTLPVAARPSGPMQRVLVKRLQRQQQLGQARLEDARRWSSERR